MKATYRGPGDTVELDGLSIKRGSSVELTQEQVSRIQRSDPYAVVEVRESEPETPLELVRIRAAQDELREDAAMDRVKAEQDALDAQDKLAREVAARATKAAKEREKLAADREAARREVAAAPAGGKKS
jgi:hypothetical protein